jgi:hypothetical protein
MTNIRAVQCVKPFGVSSVRIWKVNQGADYWLCGLRFHWHGLRLRRDGLRSVHCIA